jgi:hypothetical protein
MNDSSLPGRNGNGTKRSRHGQEPHARLQHALTAAGIPSDQHNRGALRSIIHASTGSPPPDHCDADMLAEIVLVLANRNMLKKK